MKISPLSDKQLTNTMKALAYSFFSTFFTAFVAGGGIQTTWDATYILIASCAISGVNAVAYAIVQLFKED